MARNRVIYQSEALFVSPNASGAHFSLESVITGTGADTQGLLALSPSIGLDQDPHGTMDIAGSANFSSASKGGALDLYNISGNIVAQNAAWDPASATNGGNAWNELYSADGIPAVVDKGAAVTAYAARGTTTIAKTVLILDPALGGTKVAAIANPGLIDASSSSLTSAQSDLVAMSGALLAAVPAIDNASYPLTAWNQTAATDGTTFFNSEVAWETWGATSASNTGYFLSPISGYYEAGAPEAGFVFYTNPTTFNSFLANNKTINAAGGEQLATGVLVQPKSGTYYNQIQQIHRVQSANYSFTINRTDVNTFGTLARIDAIVLEPPTVSLDFSYYPTDGFNERNLGFYIQGLAGKGQGMGDIQLNSVSGHLQDDAAGRNYFILTTPEGTDAFNTTRAIADRSVISLGNGFLSDYTIDAAVGSIPNASCTVELFNAKSDIGTTGVDIPAVDLKDGTPIADTHFTVGHPQWKDTAETVEFRGDDQGMTPSTGEVTATALRPGDITLELPDGLSIFADVSGDGAMHIQNFSLSVPLARTPIDRLGTRFAFSRVVDFPVVSTLSVSALISETNQANLATILDDCTEHNVRIRMKANQSCGVGSATDSLIIDFKGARVDSESMSSDIGSNKSVDLTFTTQIGGPEDLTRGVFMSGANSTTIPQWYPTPGK